MDKKRLRVAHLISGLRRGGRERQLCVIVSNSPPTNPIQHEILCLNREICDYEEEYGLKGKVYYFKSKSKLGRFVELSRAIRKGQPDVVFAWGSDEYLYAAGARFFFGRFITINGAIRHGIRLKCLKHLIRMLLLHASPYIVANSLAGLHANRLLPSKRRLVLYNGIENKFGELLKNKASTVRKDLKIREGAAVFISISNFVPYKDYITTLKALQLFKHKWPSFEFAFIGIGMGPMRNEIEYTAQRLGLGDIVRLIGPVDNVQDFLAAADLFIHSSLGEGCSNAILEAMYAGLPVIASDTGGTPEIVNSSYGQLFPFKDINALCWSMEQILFKRDIEKMKAAAKITAMQSFSAEAMVRSFNRILFDLAGRYSRKTHPILSDKVLY